MEISERIQNYLSILEIRQKSRRWNVTILGGIFIVIILATLAVGLVAGLNGRSVYLITGLDIVLGLTFFMAWVRLEIVRSSIELLNNIQK
ncbi:MAG: hypothetical protein PVJ21_17795 [Anaerolineales bacterium]|jgi:hypothetical protein